MNSANLLGNVKHFYENILPEASYSPDWDMEAITNAFSASRFLEQVYEQVCKKKVAAELDVKVHQFSERGDLSFCFENLRDCSLELYKAFLQNPSIESRSVQDVILKVHPNSLNHVELQSESASIDNLCYELIESLRAVAVVNSDSSFYYEVKAELLLDHLRNATAHSATESQNETQLSLVFESLCKSTKSMQILPYLLLFDNKEGSKIVSGIQEFAMSWTILQLLDNPVGLLAQFLWQQPTYRLKLMSRKYPSFQHMHSSQMVTKGAIQKL